MRKIALQHLWSCPLSHTRNRIHSTHHQCEKAQSSPSSLSHIAVENNYRRMTKSTKKASMASPSTNSVERKKKKKTTTRPTAASSGDSLTTTETKTKRSKSKSHRKASTPPSNRHGNYRDRASPENTPSPVRSRNLASSPKRSATKSSSSPKRSPSKASPKRPSSSVASGQRRVKNKMNDLSLEDKKARGRSESPSKRNDLSLEDKKVRGRTKSPSKTVDDDDTGGKGTKPAPNTIDWRSPEQLDRGLNHFLATSEWKELPQIDKVGLLAGLYTPSEMKPTYTYYCTLTGVALPNVPLKELKNRKDVSKAMMKVLATVINMLAELDSTQ